MRRWAALILAGLAAVVYLGVTAPARREAADAFQAYGRLREERRGARARLVALQRRQAALQKAEAVGGRGPTDLVALRRRILDTVRAAPVSSVHLELQPGRPPVAATVVLDLQGPTAEVLAVSGKLVGSVAGIVPDAVRYAEGEGGVTLELHGVVPGGRP